MGRSKGSIIFSTTALPLLHKLQNLLNYKSKMPVREAMDQLELISTRLRDAEKIPTDLDLDNWFWSYGFLERLKDLEDSIDNFIGEIELRQRNDSRKIMYPLTCSRPQQDLIGPSEKLNLFTISAKTLSTKLQDLGTRGATSSLTQPTRTRNLDYPVPDDSDFVGLNDKVHEVVKLLCDGEMPNTITVIGEAGSGKTFVTKTIYNTTDVKRHFQGQAWVNFSKNFEAREFLLNILTQLTWDWEFLDENLSYEELKLKLLNFSSMKRCLIVVDDARTLEDFYKLLDECGLSSGGIWLILTVSKQDVELASLEVKPCFCHLIRLRSLTDEESWTLFCKKAQIAEEEAINLKENILRKCGGSPRAILLLGGLLSTRDLSEWSSLIEHEVQKDILELCYEDLSTQLNVCFLYFGLFPRAFEIPVRRLIHLWAAERLFITLLDENMTPENLAEECLKLLIRRKLIEVTKVRLDGSPNTCRLPTTLWDVFSPIAVYLLGLFLDHNGKLSPHTWFPLRRIAYYAGTTPYDPIIQSIRSYVSFNTRIQESSTEETGKFLDTLVTRRGFGLLVVLDLENVYKPILSETLAKLLHLKYLGLRRTFLDSLPRSVGNLPYLETLDVKHTNMTTLPSSIWKAKNLQHLYLNENNFDLSFKKPYIRSEIILQTLSGLFIGNKSAVKSYLYTLLRLRKLKLTFYSKSVEGIADWISKLKALRSLKLRSIDEFDRPSTLELGSLELQTHLELLELYFLGRIPKIIESLFPPNLKILTLSASKLERDPMPILGKLGHLNCLRLFRNSYVGNHMTCHDGQFPQLQVLKLWMLENLEEWIVMEGTMPHLRELEIRCCDKLKQPVGLPLMNTLKDVVLINMSDGFVEYVESVRFNAFVKKISLPFATLPE